MEMSRPRKRSFLFSFPLRFNAVDNFSVLDHLCHHRQMIRRVSPFVRLSKGSMPQNPEMATYKNIVNASPCRGLAESMKGISGAEMRQLACKPCIKQNRLILQRAFRSPSDQSLIDRRVFSGVEITGHDHRRGSDQRLCSLQKQFCALQARAFANMVEMSIQKI